jgi:hypothetical protein
MNTAFTFEEIDLNIGFGLFPNNFEFKENHLEEMSNYVRLDVGL